MATEKFVLTFPSALVREPITSRLVRDHNLDVNILRAIISPDEQGHMVIEVTGDETGIQSGQEYLARIGVQCEPLAQDVRLLADRCVHCTACITACPCGALSVDRSTMRVSFDGDKCIGCGLCLPVCSYKAMEIMV